MDEKPVSGQEMDRYLSVYKMLEECTCPQRYLKRLGRLTFGGGGGANRATRAKNYYKVPEFSPQSHCYNKNNIPV